MDTQHLDLNQEQKKKEEIGMDATTAAMAASGITAAGVVGAQLFGNKNETPATQPEGQPTQPEEQPAQPEGQPTQPEGQPTQPEDQPTQPEDQPTQPEDQPTQPEGQPTQPEGQPTQPEGQPVQPEGQNPDIDPSSSHLSIANPEDEAIAIAEQIVNEDEIDIYDNDLPTVQILDTDIIYAEDGSEIPVALISIPGEEELYVLADVDGDRIYDYVVDANGYIVDYVEGGLNIDDAEIATADDYGYLAVTEDSIESIDDEYVLADLLILDDENGGYDYHNDYNGDEEYTYVTDDFDDEIDDSEMEDILNDLFDDDVDEV